MSIDDAKIEFSKACLNEYYNTDWCKDEEYARKGYRYLFKDNGNLFMLEGSFCKVPKEQEDFYEGFAKGKIKLNLKEK